MDEIKVIPNIMHDLALLYVKNHTNKSSEPEEYVRLYNHAAINILPLLHREQSHD